MLPNVFPSGVEVIRWSILSLCLYALISLLCAYVCVCVCLWVFGLVITSQFNLLKKDLRPPSTSRSCYPQALNFSTAVCLFFHLSCLRPYQFSFLSYLCWLETKFRSVECGFAALTWMKSERKKGERLKLSCPAESWRVRCLCHTVASRWAELRWAEPAMLISTKTHLNSAQHIFYIRRSGVNVIKCLCVCVCVCFPLKI